jgi:hypothetical protein
VGLTFREELGPRVKGSTEVLVLLAVLVVVVVLVLLDHEVLVRLAVMVVLVEQQTLAVLL